MVFRARNRVGIGIAASVSLLMVFGSQQAFAVPQEPATDAIQFGSFESSNYFDVYESIIDANGEKAAASFFKSAAAVESEPLVLPGLEELDADERRAVLLDSAEAAETSAPLDTNVVAAPEGEAIAPGNNAARDINPVYTYYLLGEAVNSGHSWQWSDRFLANVCYFWGCEAEGHIDVRFTVDPGDTSTKTSINMTTFGTSDFNVNLTSDIKSSTDGFISSYGPKHWNSPGSGVHWNHDHASLNNASFTGYFLLSIKFTTSVGNSETVQPWRTGTTLPCGDAGTGAFRCLF
jgi:hypothetical protein